MRKNIFAIFFIVLMLAFGGASVGLYIKKHLAASEPSGLEIVDFARVESFVDMYPFEDVASAPSVSKFRCGVDAIRSFARLVDRYKEAAECYTNNDNPFSQFFRDASGWYDDFFPDIIVPNGNNPILGLSNGYFAYPFPYSHPTESWDNLLNFVGYLDGKGIPFLSLIAADKGDDSFGTLPDGVPTGYSRMAEEYKEFLDANGIEYLESKPLLLASDSDFYSWFYKADHHWNVRAGRLVAEETARRLGGMGLEVDTAAVNFNLAVYPDCFLGSMGRKLGPRYKEDMEVFYPEGDTRFHIVIPSLGIDRVGSFENTLIAQKNLTNYAVFLYGDPPLVEVENLFSENNTRLLVIKQSKADVVNPYLAFAVRYLDVIDPRHFDGSIRSYIEKKAPDAVVICSDVIWEGDEKFWKLK